MKMQKGQLTFWKCTSSVLESEYGRTSYKEWCKREAKRIGECIVREKKYQGKTYIAVFKEKR
jgi:hypothetical protein